MEGIVQFLRARRDEDEQAARAAADAREPNWEYEPGLGGNDGQVLGYRTLDDGSALIRSVALMAKTDPEGEHAARHDPARVLRKVEAGRQLLTEYAKVAANDVDEQYEYAYGWANGLGYAVRLLAAEYADHPDYREEWRP